MNAGSRRLFYEEGLVEQKEREARAAEAQTRRQLALTEAQEQARQDAKRAEVLAVCAEVEHFYAQHADFLHEDMPPALLRTHVADMRETADPAAARAAAREIIAALQPLVRAGEERRKEADHQRMQTFARRRHLLSEIGSWESKAEALRTSSQDPEIVEDELQAIEQRIAEFRDQLKALDTQVNDGGQS
jgi:hypothetical protein